MQKKRNEHVAGKTFRGLGYYAHKWGDVRYARCPRCENFFPLPKAEKKPDFLIATKYAFVEAKGGIDSWQFYGDFRPNQIEFMNQNEDLSWIYVEVGPGNAPSGKVAFLMPWKKWKETESVLLEANFKSLAFKKTSRSRVPEITDVISSEYLLTWNNGMWNIPDNHVWFLKYPKE